MSDGLVFDTESHRYTVGGVVLPSVTQVIGGSGLARFDGPPGAAPFRKGTAVHEACRLLDEGKLDRSKLDDRLVGYVQAWEAFSEAVDIRYIDIERPVWHKVYRYAGTPDRYGTAKCRDGQWRPSILDIKTGGPAPWHALQTAGYALALGVMEVAKRASVYLAADGRFRYVEHENPNDGEIFLAALAVYRWRKATGAKEAS